MRVIINSFVTHCLELLYYTFVGSNIGQEHVLIDKETF